ncbi:MAG TPA: Flp family type IVb pilin [Clostridiales bacterium]|nr:Flp family type IVb pilin [Clostridiales bacterium]
MNKFSNWLKNEESGQGMVEYGLIIALITIVIMAALVVLGPAIVRMFTKF